MQAGALLFPIQTYRGLIYAQKYVRIQDFPTEEAGTDDASHIGLLVSLSFRSRLEISAATFVCLKLESRDVAERRVVESKLHSRSSNPLPLNAHTTFSFCLRLDPQSRSTVGQKGLIVKLVQTACPGARW
jgi:hypothetical protein